MLVVVTADVSFAVVIVWLGALAVTDTLQLLSWQVVTVVLSGMTATVLEFTLQLAPWQVVAELLMLRLAPGEEVESTFEDDGDVETLAPAVVFPTVAEADADIEPDDPDDAAGVDDDEGPSAEAFTTQFVPSVQLLTVLLFKTTDELLFWPQEPPVQETA